MPIVKIKIDTEAGLNPKKHKTSMDDFFRTYPLVFSRQGWAPDVDICETDDAFYIIADVSGVEEDKLRVILEGGMLFLSGFRKPFLGKETKLFHQAEIDYGPFERSFRLSPHIDPGNIEANYENGLLVIKLGRKVPEKLTRKIEIAE
jgi:HSP20 family protein